MIFGNSFYTYLIYILSYPAAIRLSESESDPAA